MAETFQIDVRQRADGRDLLRSVPPGSAPLVIFDPQYRSILDKQGYGNEGARQKGRARLPQMSERTIFEFVSLVERTLAPRGHLLLWLDKFSVADKDQMRWFRRGSTLRTVDLIAWNKGRPGMGQRTRGRTEYLMILQREPLRAKGVWRDHGIDDCWIEQADRSSHPHAKPLQLTQRLVRCLTARGDLVVDPAAGGYGVLESCRATGRRFLGCDVEG